MVYCAAAIQREEETALENLNMPICFIHNYNFSANSLVRFNDVNMRKLRTKRSG